MSDQKSRRRPSDRSTKGTKATVPDNNKRHWTTSLTAVNANERCKSSAAAICKTSRPAIAPSQILDPLIKNTPSPHSRWQPVQPPGYRSNLAPKPRHHQVALLVNLPTCPLHSSIQ